jgi:hypothetical protein
LHFVVYFHSAADNFVGEVILNHQYQDLRD